MLYEVSLKRLAKATHHKSVEMILQKDLFDDNGIYAWRILPIGIEKIVSAYFEEDILQLDKRNWQ